jgi:amidohydrolase
MKIQMKSNLLDEARGLSDTLVALRRDLHRHPELGFQETRTSSLVAAKLEEMGLPVRRGVGRTGVVAELENGKGPRVALRADMDALPIQEEGDHDYRSTVPGVMHACGHDAHTSSLLGAATLLLRARERGELPAGSIRFLFQPSEERSDDDGKSGAVRMIEDGAMKGVDAVVALHIGAHLSSGKIFLSDGPIMAGSEEIWVDVHGKSSHAARPEEGVDAVVLAAQGVIAAQQAVSRAISPMEAGVVHFGRIEGGTAPNVLAHHVKLHGTLRYFETSVRDRLARAVRSAFESLEHFGAKVELRIGPGYVPVVNDAAVTASLRRALVPLVGEKALVPMDPMMGAEDFAFLAREAPGAFYWLGAALPDAREHHHPRFDIDESMIPLGAASLVRSAVALLEERG